MQVLPLLLRHSEPELRAAAAFALTCLIQVPAFASIIHPFEVLQRLR